MRGMGLAKKIGLGALGVVAVGVVVLYTTSFGKGVRDVAGSGVVQEAMTKPPKRTYEAKDSAENLQALSTALRLYEGSEGQYPDAAKWTDEIAPRLVLNDLPKKEASKKLVRPGLGEGEYGYAMNEAAGGKYHGDLPKGTILLFESVSTARNAHGDPRRDGLAGGKGLTIEGKIVPL